MADVVAEGTKGKTVLAVFMEADDGDLGPIDRGEIRIPSYAFPEPAARALAQAARYAEWRARPEGVIATFEDTNSDTAQDVIWGALGRLGMEGGWLLPHEADAVLDAYGIPHPKSRLVHSREEAVQTAAEFGGPVALKVVAPSALHKSDVGGLALDLTGEAAVAEAYDKVYAVADDVQGVFVQEFVKGGHEVIVGMAEDPSFGPLIAFGLGGVFVELIKDISFRMNPITDLDVDEMIGEVKAAKMLQGYRGRAPGRHPRPEGGHAAPLGPGRGGAGDRRARPQPGEGHGAGQGSSRGGHPHAGSLGAPALAAEPQGHPRRRAAPALAEPVRGARAGWRPTGRRPRPAR